MELTAENYHSDEANAAYASNSQIGAIYKCPARFKARQRDEWKDLDKKILIEGQYGHALLLEPHRIPEMDASETYGHIRSDSGYKTSDWKEQADKFGVDISDCKLKRTFVSVSLMQATGLRKRMQVATSGFHTCLTHSVDDH